MEVNNNFCFQALNFVLETDVFFQLLLPLQTLLLLSSETLYRINQHSENIKSLKFIG